MLNKVVERYTTNTISHCIYHPKSKQKTDSQMTIRQLSDTITQIARHYTNNFVIAGDFNRLDMKDVSDVFGLLNIGTFPTRSLD